MPSTTLLSCSYSNSDQIEEILKIEARHKKLPFEHWTEIELQFQKQYETLHFLLYFSNFYIVT
jgi:hypothetical protein